MTALPHLTRPDNLEAVQMDLSDLARWDATPAQFRDVALQFGIAGPDFLNHHDDRIRRAAPSRQEIISISQAVGGAVLAGRLLDFGSLPNDVIKETCKRAGPFYARGAIGMPFREPWLFCHGWEMGVSWYLVQLLEPNKPGGGAFEVVELDPVQARGAHVITIGDRVFLDPADAPTDAPWHTYPAQAVPAPWRYLVDAHATINRGLNPAEAAAGNTLDPVMTALMVLATNGVRRETVAASPALQKARTRNNKPRIPPYDRIDCRGYVTALQSRGVIHRDDGRAGTHASPVPHLRRGHIRTYASGASTFVRDSLVNFTEEAKATYQPGRTHYEIDRGRQ